MPETLVFGRPRQEAEREVKASLSRGLKLVTSLKLTLTSCTFCSCFSSTGMAPFYPDKQEEVWENVFLVPVSSRVYAKWKNLYVMQ